MRKKKLIPRQMNDAILYVTHYLKGNLEGWLTHARMTQPMQIQSVPQLLFALDELFSMEDRPISICVFEARTVQEEPIATLRIQILFREHHSWQGLLIWEDNQMEAPFHSVLELIEIMDEILAE